MNRFNSFSSPVDYQTAGYLPQRNSQKPIIRWLLIIVFGFTALSVIYWLFTHSFIEVAVTNSRGGNVTLSILTDEAAESTEHDSATIRKLVRRGQHQVVISQEDTSYYAVVQAKGFLRTTRVEAKLAKERHREFVGNNPKPCLEFGNSRLISWPCSGKLSNGGLHTASTPTTPTYVTPLSSVDSNNVALETAVPLAGGLHVITKSDGAGGGAHDAFLLDTNTASLVPDSRRNLPDLSGSRNYLALPYKEGALVYSQSGDELFYYTSFEAAPTRIQAGKPETEGLELYSVSSYGEVIVLTYNQHYIAENPDGGRVSPGNIVSEEVAEHEDEGEVHEDEEILETTEVLVINGRNTRRFTLAGVAHQVRPCGKDTLCALSSNTLTVYDSTEDKLKKIYAFDGVEQIENSGKDLLIVKKEGILVFNPESRTGHFEYTFGPYSFCGLHPFGAQYVVCTALGNSKTALLVKRPDANSDSIDKKVAQLDDLPEVKNVSIYGRIIYPFPETGELVYNQELGGFTHDPAALAVAKKTIDQTIDRLGINRNTYTIISNFE